MAVALTKIGLGFLFGRGIHSFKFCVFILFLTISLFAGAQNISDSLSDNSNKKLYYELKLLLSDYKSIQSNNLKSSTIFNAKKQTLNSFSETMAFSTSEVEPTIDLLLKIEKDAEIPAIVQNFKRIEGKTFSYITGTVNLGEVEKLCDYKQVIAVEPSFVTTPFLKESVEETKAKEVWNGGGNVSVSDSIKGKGVYIGIIDVQPQIDHITFRDKSGESRITNLTPIDLNFNCEEGMNWHGTHVAGIAAGKGDINGEFSGIAPDANILWYSINSTNGIIEVIDTMKKIAGKRPLVINHSAGFNNGPRDGSLLIEEAINEKIRDTNIIFVNAAGNHASGKSSGLREENSKDLPLHFRGVIPENKIGRASCRVIV